MDKSQCFDMNSQTKIKRPKYSFVKKKASLVIIINRSTDGVYNVYRLSITNSLLP